MATIRPFDMFDVLKFNNVKVDNKEMTQLLSNLEEKIICKVLTG